MLTTILQRLRGSFGSTIPVEEKGPNPDFDPQVHAERVLRWQAENSDEKLRTNYACLHPGSILLDLGGFHGDFAFLMNGKYGAICHVFEVIPDLCEKIMQDGRWNEKIIVHPFGLARSNRREKLFLAEEGSSTFCNRSPNENQITVDLVMASEWFENELHGKMVDLMKINIEGGEYELLEHLIEKHLIKQIRNIQVQFHEDVIPNASRRMAAIH